MQNDPVDDDIVGVEDGYVGDDDADDTAGIFHEHCLPWAMGIVRRHITSSLSAALSTHTREGLLSCTSHDYFTWHATRASRQLGLFTLYGCNL